LYATGAQITGEAEARVNDMRHRSDEFLSRFRYQGTPIEAIA